jgi:hypothetical protein
MSAQKKNVLKSKKARVLLFSLGGVLAAVLFLFRKRLPRLSDRLRNRYLVLAGLFGSMGTVLFLIFRAIRFLARLYP